MEASPHPKDVWEKAIKEDSAERCRAQECASKSLPENSCQQMANTIHQYMLRFTKHRYMKMHDSSVCVVRGNLNGTRHTHSISITLSYFDIILNARLGPKATLPLRPLANQSGQLLPVDNLTWLHRFLHGNRPLKNEQPQNSTKIRQWSRK